MGVVGRQAVRQMIRVLSEEQGTLLSYVPYAELQTVWLAAAKMAIPSGEGNDKRYGGHTADTLRTVRLNIGPLKSEIEIGGSKIARFIYTGTKAHPIPLSGEAIPRLHFFWERMGGQEMFLRHVNHPGTKPNEWRVVAREIAKPGVIEITEQGVRAWMLNLRGRLMV